MDELRDSRATFLVWDCAEAPPSGDWIPVLWRGYCESNAAGFSIPRLVEEQADALRARFLGWVHDLGEAHIGGKRLVDRLVLRPGFSYWWMTLLVEKSYAKSARLFDAVKLLALENLAADRSAGRIILASGDRTLIRAIRLWCDSAGLAFELRRSKTRDGSVSLARRFYRSLPHIVQAQIFLLRYLWQRWPLRKGGGPPDPGSQLTIVDYLFHLSPRALTTGQFASNYWSDLVGTFVKGAVRVNWLHHYIRHEAVSSARQARSLIARFNMTGAETQSHTTLDSALGWPVIRRAMRDYSRLILAWLSLRRVRRHFRAMDSKVDLWPLFQQDWHRSLLGATAISNCLFLNLFERILGNRPRQAIGVYLQENQGWEMAFIHAWKAAGHGRLIAVPHSVVRYWDLRYFFDPRSYRRVRENNLPMPDLVAPNGAAAVAILRNGGYPEDKMEEVEALRYLYLADQPVRRVPVRTGTTPLRVLVLTDYVPSVTRQQMRWLTEAARLLPMDTRYIVKPHPAHPVEAGDFPSQRLEITTSSLAELLADCDVAYTSNITAAAVDAYNAGIPVVSALDGGSFNMSPLRGLAGVTYITGSVELAHALRHASESRRVVTEAYLCLDKRLPRWRKLLRLGPEDSEYTVGA